MAEPSTPLALEVQGFSCRYPETRRWVLRELTFTLRAGETLLLLGPSGCGKSTLSLCIKGLIPETIEAETRGSIRVGGVDVVAGALHTGIVFQDPESQLVMPRVDEEVAFGLENMALPREQMPERIAAALAAVGLSGKERRWADGLSGGEKQRLALAAVLAMQPPFLILDEPTANLDPRGCEAFFRALREVKSSRSLTVLLIEHRLDQVLPLVDRVLALSRDGRLLAWGSPREVFGRKGELLEEQGIWLPTPRRVVGELRRRGVALAGSAQREPSAPLTVDEGAALLGPLLAKLKRYPVEADARLAPQPAAPAAARGPEPAIAAAGLRYAYPQSGWALREVSLEVHPGSFAALAGANGSGKSTLARILCGLLRPAGGAVSLFGTPLARLSGAQLVEKIGYVFQNPEHQFVTERVKDELAYSLRRRLAAEEVPRRVAGLLEEFGLEGYEEANPFSLSQGQKRRLSVATMIALGQPILILDEPTFGQDQASAGAIMARVRGLHRQGKTILFITHDMQLVLRYATEVLVLQEGRLVFRGAPLELFCQSPLLEACGLAAPPEVELGRRLGDPSLFAGADWAEGLTRRLEKRYPVG